MSKTITKVRKLGIKKSGSKIAKYMRKNQGFYIVSTISKILNGVHKNI